LYARFSAVSTPIGAPSFVTAIEAMSLVMLVAGYHDMSWYVRRYVCPNGEAISTLSPGFIARSTSTSNAAPASPQKPTISPAWTT
jgi:hypothetical protein